MWHNFLALVFLINSNFGQYHRGYQLSRRNTCWSAYVRNGECKPVSKCSFFSDNTRGEKSSVSFLLMGDRCGYQDNQLNVCCPKKEVSTELTTQSPRVQTFQTLRTTREVKTMRTKPIPKATSSTTTTTTTPFSRLVFQNNDTSKEDSSKEPASDETGGEGRKTVHPNRRLLSEITCGVKIPERVLGGTSADLDEFPWMALLEYRDPVGNKTLDCSGVLISTRYVLTAAHCTNGTQIVAKGLRLVSIRLGEWDTSSDRDCQGPDFCSLPVQTVSIEEVVTHRNYRPRQRSQFNDIALIRLKREVQVTKFVRPICLPLDELAEKNYEGIRAFSAGWGRTSNKKNSASSRKLKVILPVTRWSECQNFYKSFYNTSISRNQLCAGGEEGKDTCQGDSGGPLMVTEVVNQDVRWYTIGIVSTGPGACGVKDSPALYTKVPDYIGWILDSIRE